MSFYEESPHQSISAFLNKKQIEDLHKLFHSSKTKTLTKEKFRKSLEKLGFYLDDAKFDKFYLKIDLNRDDAIDWHEFISYLLLEFRDNDPSNQKEKLSLPITESPKSFSAQHRNNIIKIHFTPSLMPDGNLNSLEGEWLLSFIAWFYLNQR
jgi:hypothetical protein